MLTHSDKGLYYITHIDNTPTILRDGILSAKKIEEQGIPFASLYSADTIARRAKRLTPDRKSLWEYASVYFQPRNPMLYRVMNDIEKKDVVVLGLNPQIVETPGALISLGNAVSPLSALLNVEEGLTMLNDDYWAIINSDWWKTEDGTKRKIMAECLVPEQIPAAQIQSIYVPNQSLADKLKPVLNNFALEISVFVEPHMFFQQKRQGFISDKIFWIDGDIFFSPKQTLTVDVNTGGLMMKGLAARAKYQFPDIYVAYQDTCMDKSLTIGRPFLYKREVALEVDLADEHEAVPNSHANKWFLLFPTTEHVNQNADLKAIEKGLQWLVESFIPAGIQSIALPALGCGAGGLDWKEVGPLMCKYLSRLDIQVEIYLPQEQQIAPEFLTRKFLLEM